MKWEKVFTSAMNHQAEIVKGVLEEHGIQAIIINKQASSYNNFGCFEILVNPYQIIDALTVLENEVQFSR
ncbi:MAG: hypothetical protein EAZ97_10150 [Bacteroidetes bacterium]|nr:MAG: hypothetical protein EAZ97_10150 [Bacteroidota bacterium]